MNWQGKVVIVTGASSGIGKAYAELFGQKGASVVLAARSVQSLEEVKAKISATASGVLVVKADVSVEDDCKNLIETTVKEFGKIDVLINNAGISMRSLLNDTDTSVIKRLMEVNFYGTLYCTKYALPYLLKSKGSVLGVSSIAGYVGLPARTGYSASKFAMQGFLDALRTENLKKGLHVMIACPGFTASNIRNTALAADGNAQGESPREEDKMMTAEEVAKHIYNGVLNRKRSLVLTTVGKLAVFLSKFFPSFIEK